MAAKTVRIATAIFLTAALATAAYAQHRGGGGGFRGGGGGGGGMSRGGGGFGGGHVGGGGGFGGRAIGAPGVGGGGFGGRGFGGGQAFRPGFIGRPGSLGRPGSFGRPIVGSRVITGHRQVIIRQGQGVTRFGGLGGQRVGPGLRPGLGRVPGVGGVRRVAGVGGPNRVDLARHGLRARTIVNPAFHGRVGPRLAGTAFRGGWRHHFRFHHRHRARFFALGFAGPLFWPYAYDDFYDYVFLPHAYDEFWPYAYDDVFAGIYGGYSQAGVAGARLRTARGPSGSESATPVCGEGVSGLTDLPIERITQTVQPNEAQRAALEQLKAATERAVEILRTACPTDLPSTPPGRLEAMEKRLGAMLEAVQVVRPKLEAFYQSLSDEQKARFNAVALQGDGGGVPVAQEQRELTRMCTSRSELLPIDRIAQVVGPTDAQRAAFDELKAAAAKAAQVLNAECPKSQALTPTGRVEAMEKRLATVLEAVRTVRPALENFWNALTDEQKARFNRLNAVAQR